MTRLATCLSVLAATALASAAAAGAGEEPVEKPKARALRIALVDVDRVLKEYKKGNDLYDKIRKEIEPLANMIKQKAKYIREQQRQLAATPDPRADRIDYLKKKHKIEVQLAELQRDEKEYLARRTEKEVEAMTEVWKDVVAAVAKYAKENGYDMVLKQQVRDEKTKTKTGFYRNVAARTVLYSAAHLDITEAIIKQLNTDYDRGKSAAKG
jgi:Skp family chaperone for outer membrane proteins